MKEIARRMIDDYSRNLKRVKSISLEVDDDALEFIMEHGYEPAQGVRHLSRSIEELVDTRLSEMSLNGKLKNGMIAEAYVDGDSLDFQVYLEVLSDDSLETEGGGAWL